MAQATSLILNAQVASMDTSNIKLRDKTCWADKFKGAKLKVLPPDFCNFTWLPKCCPATPTKQLAQKLVELNGKWIGKRIFYRVHAGIDDAPLGPMKYCDWYDVWGRIRCQIFGDSGWPSNLDIQFDRPIDWESPEENAGFYQLLPKRPQDVEPEDWQYLEVCFQGMSWPLKCSATFNGLVIITFNWSFRDARIYNPAEPDINKPIVDILRNVQEPRALMETVSGMLLASPVGDTDPSNKSLAPGLALMDVPQPSTTQRVIPETRIFRKGSESSISSAGGSDGAASVEVAHAEKVFADGDIEQVEQSSRTVATDDDIVHGAFVPKPPGAKLAFARPTGDPGAKRKRAQELADAAARLMTDGTTKKLKTGHKTFRQ